MCGVCIFCRGVDRTKDTKYETARVVTFTACPYYKRIGVGWVEIFFFAGILEEIWISSIAPYNHPFVWAFSSLAFHVFLFFCVLVCAVVLGVYVFTAAFTVGAAPLIKILRTKRSPILFPTYFTISFGRRSLFEVTPFD